MTAGERLAAQIASLHNLAFYLWLVKEARIHIIKDDFKDDLETYDKYYEKMKKIISKKTANKFNL